jgi:hypothetical protein
LEAKAVVEVISQMGPMLNENLEALVIKGLPMPQLIGRCSVWSQCGRKQILHLPANPLLLSERHHIVPVGQCHVCVFSFVESSLELAVTQCPIALRKAKDPLLKWIEGQ